jgi:hypothetical protein
MLAEMDENVARAKGKGIAGALRTVALASGQSFSMRTKPGRFRIQKAVYLLKALDYPSAKRFEYNIYLNGPYSPELAQVYYALDDEGIARGPPAGDVPISTLSVLSEALSKGEDFLEALTTVVDGLTREESVSLAMNWARSIKPHLDESTWREVRRFLADHPEFMRHS